MRTEIHMYYFLGEFFFATVTGFFSNSSNLTRKSVFFFCDSLHGEEFFFFATVQRGFFATVSCDEGFLRRFNGFFLRQFNVFFLRHFRRVKMRSGWYSVHRSGSGATYDR